jgi:flagellar motility protein MotE (MotC chaperone)
MRRFIPYLIIFLGIVAISKLMTIIKSETSLVDVTNLNAKESYEQIIKETEGSAVKSKVPVTNQKGELLINLYNTDTSQIRKIATCDQLYDLKFSPEEVKILQTLRNRHEKLNELEKDIAIKEEVLRNIEDNLYKKLEQIEKLSSQMGDETSGSMSQSYSKLVKIYEGMKPKEAAKIFDTLQTQVLLGVAQQMKENKLAAIVAEMKPDKARDLTMGLVNRKD